MKPLSLSRPHLIVMIGIPGAGKSTFAERFSETFKAPLVSPDTLQHVIFGNKFGKEHEEAVAEAVSNHFLKELLKTNQTIIYVESTGTRRVRQDLAKIANDAKYVPLFVWVQTDTAEASRRAQKTTKEVTGMTAEQFNDAVRRFTVPVASEQAIVISGKHTYVSQLKNVLKHLAGEHVPAPLEVQRRNNLIR